MQSSTDSSRARAMALLSQGRLDLAEPHVREVLAGEPDDGWAHAVLAMCLSAKREHKLAIAQVNHAVAATPNNPFVHYVKSSVLSGAEKHQLSLASIREALKLDPEDVDYHSHHAAVLLDCEKPEEALAAAEQALALDAKHVGALNCRTHALMQLGRFDGAQASLNQSLVENPENDATHTAAGFYHLQTGDSDKSTEHFLQALRLDPNDANAKQGLLMALKAKHRIYRGMLMFLLWLGRQPTAVRWGTVIGIIVLRNLFSGLAKDVPALAPVFMPIAIALGLVFLMMWLANPMFNLVLRIHPLGRHLITERHRAKQNCWLAFLCIIVLFFIAAFTTKNDQLTGWILGASLILMPLAVALAHDGKRRRHYLIVTSLLAMTGVAAMFLSFRAADRVLAGVIALSVYVLGCIVLPLLRFAFTGDESR